MKKYLLSFFGGNQALRYSNLEKVNEEERKKHQAAWGDWMANLVKINKLEVGYPLESKGKRITSDKAEDYHFPDSTEGGFIIIKADSPDDATEIAKSSPILKNGGYILVRPCGEIK